MDAPAQTIRVSVADRPIDPESLLGEVGRADSGATVLFLGTVRDHSDGKEGVTHLEYEVYSEMVESKIGEIVAEAAARWPVLSVAAEHRSGEVKLGLYKGNIEIHSRTSPNSLYDAEIASMEAGGGYNQDDAEGFLRIMGLPVRVSGRVTPRSY